jgi:hypothetical protein
MNTTAYYYDSVECSFSFGKLKYMRTARCLWLLFAKERSIKGHCLCENSDRAKRLQRISTQKDLASIVNILSLLLAKKFVAGPEVRRIFPQPLISHLRSRLEQRGNYNIWQGNLA